MDGRYKRFIVFGYDLYYPSGALSDSILDFDSIDELTEQTRNTPERFLYDTLEIFDLQERKIIWEGGSSISYRDLKKIEEIMKEDTQS
ncbi:hypothetical protein [Bacillus velezensis]|uniref:hypothetical protein n=1 Tax=Bacillus velezensis TaxID=492670 RepID=UPI001C0CD91C|nr:hypothetical protein [Bacillus velezensis]QWQ47353.1 hypothetical protein KOM03_17855 [Bacillus velezensis]